MDIDAPTIHEEVAAVGDQLAGLTLLLETPESKEAAAVLHSSWQRLLELLALPPESETLHCPVCRHLARRSATLCGFCWTVLKPLQ
jgi:hypothetical protein